MPNGRKQKRLPFSKGTIGSIWAATPPSAPKPLSFACSWDNKDNDDCEKPLLLLTSHLIVVSLSLLVVLTWWVISASKIVKFPQSGINGPVMSLIALLLVKWCTQVPSVFISNALISLILFKKRSNSLEADLKFSKIATTSGNVCALPSFSHLSSVAVWVTGKWRSSGKRKTTNPELVSVITFIEPNLSRRNGSNWSGNWLIWLSFTFHLLPGFPFGLLQYRFNGSNTHRLLGLPSGSNDTNVGQSVKWYDTLKPIPNRPIVSAVSPFPPLPSLHIPFISFSVNWRLL